MASPTDAYLERQNMLHGAMFACWLYSGSENPLPEERYRRTTVALGIMEMSHAKTSPTIAYPTIERMFNNSSASFLRA